MGIRLVLITVRIFLFISESSYCFIRITKYHNMYNGIKFDVTKDSIIFEREILSKWEFG